MTRFILPATAAFFLSFAGPAAAECADEIAELQARVDQLPASEETEPTESVQVETEQGDATVTAPEGGAEPQERWFHLPRSVEGAQEQLADARQMAEDGDEQGCMELVEDARELISGLEESEGAAQ